MSTEWINADRNMTHDRSFNFLRRERGNSILMDESLYQRIARKLFPASIFAKFGTGENKVNFGIYFFFLYFQI